jgi:hypothetical protein
MQKTISCFCDDKNVNFVEESNIEDAIHERREVSEVRSGLILFVMFLHFYLTFCQNKAKVLIVHKVSERAKFYPIGRVNLPHPWTK